MFEPEVQSILRRHLRLALVSAVAVAGAILSPPAAACSPSLNSLAGDLRKADAAIRGNFRVVSREAASAMVEQATIEIELTHNLKWPIGVPWRRTFTVTEIGYYDGVNCPPWYDDDRNVFFTFKQAQDGSLELYGVYYGFDE